MATTKGSIVPNSRHLLSARRALISLSAGLVTGGLVGLLATPRLLPLVSWTVTVAVLLTWVWWMSWPQDSASSCHGPW